MNLLPFSENATLKSMLFEVNHMHPLESVLKAAGGCDCRHALVIPGKSPIRVRDSMSIISIPPAPGTHSLPKRSSWQWLTMSPMKPGISFCENLMKESPSYLTSPPPKVPIQAYPLLSK